jgi:hypothetical protein
MMRAQFLFLRDRSESGRPNIFVFVLDRFSVVFHSH